MKEHLKARAIREAKSISPQEVGQFSDTLYSSSTTRPYTASEIRYLISIADKTKGHPDALFFAHQTASYLSLDQAYPAECQDDIFRFAASLLTDYRQNSKPGEFVTPATGIFTRLQDPRAIPVLKAYPRTGIKRIDFEIDKAIADLSGTR